MLAGAGPVKGKSGQRLMLVLGEVDKIAEGRLGHQLVLTEAPDCRFLLPDDLHTKMRKRFATELALWASDDDVRLVVFGTFAVTTSGVPTLHELTLMVVTRNWIPFESGHDKLLVDTVTAAHRPFVKGLRYNLAQAVPIAAMVLPDTGNQSTALYLADPADDDTARRHRDELVESSELVSWVWSTGDDMPALPARHTAHRQEAAS